MNNTNDDPNILTNPCLELPNIYPVLKPKLALKTGLASKVSSYLTVNPALTANPTSPITSCNEEPGALWLANEVTEIDNALLSKIFFNYFDINHLFL